VSQAVKPQFEPQLAEISFQLKRNSLQVIELFQGLYSHQLNLRLESDRWSIAECIVHLNLFSETFVPMIVDSCECARAEGWFCDGPFKMDVVGRLLKYALEPPSKWNAVTSAAFEPTVVEPLDRVVPTFLELQSQLTQIIEETSGLDLNRIKIVSPVSSHVRYNLYSCFLILAAHQRRHLWQAEQTRSALMQRETVGNLN
jgi:hypothetical protein